MVFQRKKTEKSTALSVRAIAAQVILQVLDQGYFQKCNRK